MKLRDLRVEQSPRLMIIPMIDIIFFLLVFFMMSTLYTIEQRVMPVALPQASTAQISQDIPVPITITAQGKIIVDQEEIPRALLAQHITAEIARNKEATFMLRADRRIAYGEVIRVLDELKKAGVRRIMVATEKQ